MFLNAGLYMQSMRLSRPTSKLCKSILYKSPLARYLDGLIYRAIRCDAIANHYFALMEKS